MNKIKKLMITLVALLALTTGAWAQTVTVKELTASEITAWANDDTNITAADLPGFVEATTEQAQSWDGYPTNGFAYLIYGFDNGEIKKITYYSGNAMTPSQTPKTRAGVYDDMNRSTPDRYFYVTGITAGSAVTVDWDKAKKTGSFTMPGGNVTLEPEYYPQAALTAAPSAINDVPATTDGAIVNAGTVANIDGTTTAQGTVMYYAVQSETAPTAPGYDATGWTDKVPTATDFAEGNVYVWYYVKGADGDETSTFSDGAITKLGESGYITLLAAPTYAVTFAEGVNPEPPAEPEWTASPNAGVTKGQPVTVTYTGTKKVLGVKAEKKAAAVPKAAKDATAEDVGKLIGADGNIYDDADAATAANTTAVAMIAYVGSDAETSTTYNHGLALALSDVSSSTYTWCSQTSATCLASGHQYDTTTKFNDLAGIANTDALVSHTDHTHAAASAARNYNSGTHPTGTSEWFLPSAGQWNKMIGVAGLSNLGLPENAYYWSSSERSASRAWFFGSDSGSWLVGNKDTGYRVRACLAF